MTFYLFAMWRVVCKQVGKFCDQGEIFNIYRFANFKLDKNYKEEMLKNIFS